jgi:subtilisin family serine protease
MAPGGDVKRDDDEDGKADGIWSLVAPSEKNPMGVAAYEGTSMAAPHVSAAIALAIAHNEKLRKNPNAIEEMVAKAAVKPVARACPEQKPCGKGQLNAVKLLTR